MTGATGSSYIMRYIHYYHIQYEKVDCITNYALVSTKSATEPKAPQAKDMTFVAVITSAVEMKKSQAKWMLKGVEFMFNLDEPWDTLKAQILAKIESILKPKHLDFDDFDVSFFIP